MSNSLNYSSAVIKEANNKNVPCMSSQHHAPKYSIFKHKVVIIFFIAIPAEKLISGQILGHGTMADETKHVQ
jgi:hypothetical protein